MLNLEQAAIQEGLDEFDFKKAEKEREMKKKKVEQGKQEEEISGNIFKAYLDHDPDKDRQLKNQSRKVKNKVFSKLLKAKIHSAIGYISDFFPLPASFQSKILRALFDYKKNADWHDYDNLSFDRIITGFDQITNKQLFQFLMKDTNALYRGDLLRYKDRLPLLTEKEILDRYWRGEEKHRYPSSWAGLIPFIDKFPSVNKKKAIEGVLKTYDSSTYVLIDNKEKLKISFRELIDMFEKFGKTYKLCERLKKIPSEYHQEIVDKIIIEGRGWTILKNHKDFKEINISQIFRTINTQFLIRDYSNISQAWLDQIPQDIINEIIKVNASVIARNMSAFNKKVNKEELVNIFFEQKRFEVLLNNYKELGIKVNDDFILKIIEMGGASKVALRIDKLPRMSRKIYFKLVEEETTSDIYLNILKFDEIEKEDFFNALVKTSYSTATMAIDIIEDPSLIKNLSLNEELAEKLIDDETSCLHVIHSFDKFTIFDKRKFIIMILKKISILDFVDKIKYLPKEAFTIAKEYLEKKTDLNSLSVLYLFAGPKKDWQELLGRQEMNDFLNNLPKDKQRDEKRNAFTHNEYDRTSEFLQYVNKDGLFFVNKEELDIAGEYIKKYGLAKQGKLYKYFRNIKLFENGKLEKIPQGQSDDGIKNIDVLEEKYKKIQELIFSNKELLAEDLKKLGSFEIELLDQATGKSSHSFNGNGRSMKEMIDDFIDYSSSKKHDGYYYHESLKNEYVPVPEEYKSVNIKSSSVSYEFDAEKLKAEDSYYNILKAEILDSFDLEKEDDRKLEKFVLNVKEKIELNKKILEEKKDIPFQEKQLKFYNDLLVKVSGVKSYDELLIEILKIKSKKRNRLNLTSDLRKIVFRKTLAHKISSGQDIEELRNHLLNSEASGEAVLALSNLIEILIKNHVLNLEGKNKDGYWTEEAWEQLLKLKKDKKQISVLNMFTPHLGELRKEVKSLIIIETGEGNVLVSCDPVGGFMGEMSAYLGKACYSAEYPLLARYPNLIPYRFTNNTDPDNKELLGSVLVFELESEEGEKVALLRAFNIPDETKVNVSKFIEDFIEGISSDLKARGIKKIIIPGAKGTISNHAMILRHMCQTYIDGKEPISLSKTFDFNRQGNNDSYDITHNCYVARKL